jgi:organic radical activating enzyme
VSTSTGPASSQRPPGAAAGDSASLVEVFASIQGEGPELGRSTVFVRFGGCDLRCTWCDSPGTWRETPTCRVETEAGRGRFEERANPLPVAEIADVAHALAPHPSTWISLTGGEPLLQPEALEALVDDLSRRGRRLYLETHGLHAEALARVASRIDRVSMDWKLASDVRWGPGVRGAPKDFHALHEAFLRVAQRARSVYVKVVVTPSSRDDEFEAMLDRIESVSREIPLVIQPVTPAGGVHARPDPERLFDWLVRAEGRLADVRVIPQTHPIYGAP